MKAVKWLDERFEETLLAILLVLISCVELIQVVIRNVPWIPALTWAEEFCRFCWIWSVFLSLPYTVRKASMLRVNVLMDVMPKKVKNAINIIVDVVVAATMGLLGVHSVSVIRRIMKSGETSSAMQWPMWIVYIVMLIGFFLAVLRGIQQAILHIRSFNETGLTVAEQTMAEAAEEIEEAGKRTEGGQ
ncbi:MAG: TRAP transporter small permease [Oscillospiraceae bacterium]|nr:TRAP transporter small permease [Oscillospiraceae bacterium]